MTKIYTKTGDLGETGLWGGGRVRKDHPRVRAYGDVDELNCALGAALAALPDGADAFFKEALLRVQEELFTVGAALATPAGKKVPALPPDAVSRLESEIDRWTGELEPLRKFILPGGSSPGALLHVARAVCRRAEREVVSLAGGDKAPEAIVVYLNRLSDHLFTAARWINRSLRRAEVQWQGLN